eukprot:309345_1
MLEMLRQFEKRTNKERTEVLAQLNLKYMDYVNTLLQQKMNITRKINEQYDNKIDAIQDLISKETTQRIDNMQNIVLTVLNINDTAPITNANHTTNINQSANILENEQISTSSHSQPIKNDIKTNNSHGIDFSDESTVTSASPTDIANHIATNTSMMPSIDIEPITSNISDNIVFESFIAHMSLEEASQLSINDEIDHRDFVGRSISSIIVDKNESKLKIRYIGWDSKWDIWSDYKNELHKFAKHKSISTRTKHRLLSLKIGDYIDIKPVNNSNENMNVWTIGEVVEFDKQSGQINIVYIINSNYKYQWSHLDNENEIQPLQTKQLLLKPPSTHEEIIKNNNNKKQSNNSKYHCIYCTQWFKTNKLVRNHVISIHKDRKYPCCYCVAAFAYKSSLKYHTKQHTRNKKYKCELCYSMFECSTTFADQYQLVRHQNTIHKINNISNYNISKTNKQSKKIKIENNYTNKYHCNYCKQSFKSNELLRGHLILRHSKERKHICSLCPVASQNKNSLVNHMVIHERNGKYKCELCFSLFRCNTSFVVESKLTEHINKYHKKNTQNSTNTKKRKSIFRKRKKIENIVQPLETHDDCLSNGCYYCVHCKDSNISFENDISLREHLETIHGSTYPFICFECPQSFTSELCLNNHMKQHGTNGNYKCDLCKISFDNQDVLANHKQKLHHFESDMEIVKPGQKRKSCTTADQPQKKKLKEMDQM